MALVVYGNKKQKTSATSAGAGALAVGQVHEVGELLAERVSKGGKRSFVVRWHGHDHKQDTWESENNIKDTSLIAAFEQWPLKATWSQTKRDTHGAVPPRYLIDEVLSTRMLGGTKPQSFVRWYGFPTSWDMWINDDQIVICDDLLRELESIDRELQSTTDGAGQLRPDGDLDGFAIAESSNPIPGRRVNIKPGQKMALPPGWRRDNGHTPPRIIGPNGEKAKSAGEAWTLAEANQGEGLP